MEARTWISKEVDCTDSITVQQIGNVKVAEVTTTTVLEELTENYKRSKDKAQKKEIKAQYALVAAEMNRKHKGAHYIEAL